MRSARPGSNDPGATTRYGNSKLPTVPAESSSAETVLTLAPRRPLAKNRALYVALPAFAFVFALAGAWVATSFRKPPAAATLPPAAALAPPSIEHAAAAMAAPAPAPSEPGEPAPAASTAKTAAAKTKARVPSARKKGHDFGF